MPSQVNTCKAWAVPGEAHLDIGDDQGEAQAIDGPEEDGLMQAAGDAEAHRHDAPDQAPHCDHPDAVPVMPCAHTSA